MEKRVLVVYASKYGSTAQIAEKIGLRLKKAGLEVDVIPADQVKGLEGYRAVVLGSGVYAGQWLKGAADFLKKHEKALAHMPVWFFSGGPTGIGDPVELMKGLRFPETLEPVAERIKPRDIAFFHGVIDMDKLKFAEKMTVRALKAPVGDFRDWESIHAWADRIARVLK